MGDKKFPIRMRYRADASGGATDRVQSEIIHRNTTIACQSIAFRNRTGTRGNVEIWLEHNGDFTFITDQTTPAANRWYWYPYTQHIKTGERIVAIQQTGIQGDVLDLHIVGYTTFGPDPVLPRGGQ